MIQESALDKILYQIKKFIPTSVFGFFQPMYHELLAYAGALRYGFPSRGMKVIGITGTKGKSTTVYLVTKILEDAGCKVACIGSLGFKIGDREWPNTLKMTMPGRFRLQKFLAEAKRAGCEYVVLEVTSEGIKQKRHLGIKFDSAVFTNIHKEHLESHGSFENYIKAKQELFKIPKRLHILNVEDAHVAEFEKFPVKKIITYGLSKGDVHPTLFDIIHPDYSKVYIDGEMFELKLGGEFNVSNAIAAWAVGIAYGISPQVIAHALSMIEEIPGRMDFVQKKPFAVVVDYAHTPDSLRAVYLNLKKNMDGKLICVLGAAGGGRDKWKRAEFGAIADKLVDEIVLTDEDPYEENPETIIEEIKAGIKRVDHLEIILDRKEAIGHAIRMAREGDIVIITGKGSETSMAVAGNKKITWSDRDIVRSYLSVG